MDGPPGGGKAAASAASSLKRAHDSESARTNKRARMLPAQGGVVPEALHCRLVEGVAQMERALQEHRGRVLDLDAFVGAVLPDEPNGHDGTPTPAALISAALGMLRSNLSKGWPLAAPLQLSLMVAAKSRPKLFAQQTVLTQLLSCLSIHTVRTKSDTSLVTLAASLLLAALADTDAWPPDLVAVYFEDALGERMWADAPEAQTLVANILTVLDPDAISAAGPASQAGSPAKVATTPGMPMSPGNDDWEEMEEDEINSSAANGQDAEPEGSKGNNGPSPRRLSRSAPIVKRDPVRPRFRAGTGKVVVERVTATLIGLLKKAPAQTESVMKTLASTVRLPEIRVAASKCLNSWLAQPSAARLALEFLPQLVRHCRESAKPDYDTLVNLLRVRLKPKAQQQALKPYLEQVNTVLANNAHYPGIALQYLVGCEVNPKQEAAGGGSAAPNPHSMALVERALLAGGPRASEGLAAIFQDMLAKRQDLRSPLRAFLFKVARLGPFENLGFARALTKTRGEPQFVNMDQSLRERYAYNLVDAVAMSCLLAPSAELVQEAQALQLAAAALKPGQSADLGAAHPAVLAHRRALAAVQETAVGFLRGLVPRFLRPSPQMMAHSLRKALFHLPTEAYFGATFDALSDFDKKLFGLVSAEPFVTRSTLTALMAMGASPDFPLSSTDSLLLVVELLRRALRPQLQGLPAILWPPPRAEGSPSGQEEEALLDALLRASLFQPNVRVPPTVAQPVLHVGAQYWQAWRAILFLAAAFPATFGRAAWRAFPTARLLMTMAITNRFEQASSPASLAAMVAHETERARSEGPEIVAFEAHLAAAIRQPPPTAQTSKLLGAVFKYDPRAAPRVIPPPQLDEVRRDCMRTGLGPALCRCRDPDYLTEVMAASASTDSLAWLGPVISVFPELVVSLPTLALCDVLVREQGLLDAPYAATILSKLGGDASRTPAETTAILTFFLGVLGSPKATERAMAKRLLRHLAADTLRPQQEGAGRLPLSRLCELGPLQDRPGDIAKAFLEALRVDTDAFDLCDLLGFVCYRAAGGARPAAAALLTDLSAILGRRPVALALALRTPSALAALHRLHVAVFLAAEPPPPFGDVAAGAGVVELSPPGSDSALQLPGPVCGVALAVAAVTAPNSPELLNWLWTASRRDAGAGLALYARAHSDICLDSGELRLSFLLYTAESGTRLALRELRRPGASRAAVCTALAHLSSDEAQGEAAALDFSAREARVLLGRVRSLGVAPAEYAVLGRLAGRGAPRPGVRRARDGSDGAAMDASADAPGPVASASVTDLCRAAFQGPDGREAIVILCHQLRSDAGASTAADVFGWLESALEGGDDALRASVISRSSATCPLLALCLRRGQIEASRAVRLLEGVELGCDKLGGRADAALLGLVAGQLRTRCADTDPAELLRAGIARGSSSAVRRACDLFLDQYGRDSGAATGKAAAPALCHELLRDLHACEPAQAVLAAVLKQTEGRAGFAPLLAHLLASERNCRGRVAPLILDTVLCWDPDLAALTACEAPALPQFVKLCASRLLSNVVCTQPWSTVRSLLRRLLLLAQADTSRLAVPPSTLLDFLAACARKVRSAQPPRLGHGASASPTSLECLPDEVCLLVAAVVAELQQVHDSLRQETLRSRTSLLLAVAPSADCLTDALATDGLDVRHPSAVRDLMIQLYLAQPSLVRKLPAAAEMGSFLQTSHLDASLHRLVVALLEVRAEEENSPAALHSGRTEVAYKLLRNVAANHFLRTIQYLPTVTSMLKGRAHLHIREFRRRNYPQLFTLVLGITDVLRPSIFDTEHRGYLAGILEPFLELVEAYCKGRRDPMLSGPFAKLVALLHELARLQPDIAKTMLEPHQQSLRDLAATYPESRAGMLVEALATPLPPRPLPKAFAAHHIGQMWQRLAAKPCPLEALESIDRASSFQPDILRHFDQKLMDLAASSSRQCRELALQLLVRLCTHKPLGAHPYARAFVALLHSPGQEVVASALPFVPDFVLACPECSLEILEAAFRRGASMPGLSVGVELRRTLRMLHVTGAAQAQ